MEKNREPKENEILVCPTCKGKVSEEWQNTGFNAPEPTHWEIAGYKCTQHGWVEPIIITIAEYQNRARGS